MAEPQGIFAFPRGARAGQCLHGILEAMDFQGEDGPEFRALVERQLLRQGLPAHWRDMLAQWLWRLPEVILDEASGLTLGHIDKASRIAEMGFHLPLQPLHAEDLRDLLDEWRGARGPKLDFAPVQGMLNGFIDLIIQHQGRYFVIDYKSNHLGNRHQDYSQTAMDKAVRAHQYDLQYLIYCVALHRYLRYRQPDYDFEQHFGGVFYLFLRGMQPAGGDTGVYRDRPAKTLIESLDRLFGAPAKEDATC
jgi:exodeoxyribonuclease V beta subunit